MKIISKIFIIVGIVLILISLNIIIFNYYLEVNASKKSTTALENMKKLIVDKSINEGIKTTESIKIDGYDYVGYMSIPKLNLNLPVIDSYSYDKLKIAPNLYYGEFNTKNFIICAHNYKTHFGSIGGLQFGDIIVMTSVNNENYYYQVELVEELDSTEINEMLNNEFDLTLFTCTKNGRSRVTVRCNKVDS